jgi:ring-1,2-phenylacetyl-CoA epoxidase subunit PaaD
MNGERKSKIKGKYKTTKIKLNINKEEIWQFLETVKDPEVPVLSIIDLGIVRNVEWVEEAADKGFWNITITPTYSGCPAMDMISTQIRMTLYASGIDAFEINTILSPAWTTEWMTVSGKEKLREYGIAPPHPLPAQYADVTLIDPGPAACPRCQSAHTHRISEFGSTACKALYQCDDCKEPFDYFKCH